ncbi:hypothetical protein ACFPT7_14555 [Acidicapsa dinghuensis]|uniref:Uncharacterized protein n=1 Tax=Acidicapsa dinghuensis TaxID=2218256 RepID=A0ABW1EGS6_9BACT|nr:hypothetical protein [Acidicapsa dinghuensis]
MSTYYKPTVRNGKRVIYRSIDPEEQKNALSRSIVPFLIFALVALLLQLLPCK